MTHKAAGFSEQLKINPVNYEICLKHWRKITTTQWLLHRAVHACVNRNTDCIMNKQTVTSLVTNSLTTICLGLKGSYLELRAWIYKHVWKDDYHICMQVYTLSARMRVSCFHTAIVFTYLHRLMLCLQSCIIRTIPTCYSKVRCMRFNGTSPNYTQFQILTSLRKSQKWSKEGTDSRLSYIKLLHQDFTVHQLPLLEHKFYILVNCDASGNCVLLLRSLKSKGWRVQHFLNSGERRRQKEMSTNQNLKEK